MTVKKQAKKLKLSKEGIRLAQRYEKAWHKVFYQSSRWVQSAVTEEPFGRHAGDLAREAARLAESGEEL